MRILEGEKYDTVVHYCFIWIYFKQYTEGCNNAIKTLKRVAFGFRNFRSFRARILLSLGPYPNI